MNGAWLNCVIFSLRVSYSQQDVLLAQPNKFPFSQAKGVISTARVAWFSRALTCFPRSNIHIKNYSAIARRKNIPFYGKSITRGQSAVQTFLIECHLLKQPPMKWFARLAWTLYQALAFLRVIFRFTAFRKVIIRKCSANIFTWPATPKTLQYRIFISRSIGEKRVMVSVGHGNFMPSYS